MIKRVWRPVGSTAGYAALGVDQDAVPKTLEGARRFLDLYIASLLVWGLVAIEVRLTVFGAVLIAYGQLWRIDRLGIFYDVEAPGR
ncbi:hypothetical protein ACH4U7_22040 [Streptomyces sp. NPDC020845]|uniref:hypothetical protein n=1 Tax=Streptomyces sp. NPDC020845 TaxID=3365096 RepID=UPI00378BAC34